MAKAKTDNGQAETVETVTLSLTDLEAMMAKVAKDAVANVTKAAAKTESAKSPVDLTDSVQVAKTKVGKATSKFWGNGGQPGDPATFKMRKGIAAFGSLPTTSHSDRVFRGPLTKVQASTARHYLEDGQPIKLDDLVIEPK